LPRANGGSRGAARLRRHVVKASNRFVDGDDSLRLQITGSPWPRATRSWPPLRRWSCRGCPSRTRWRWCCSTTAPAAGASSARLRWHARACAEIPAISLASAAAALQALATLSGDRGHGIGILAEILDAVGAYPLVEVLDEQAPPGAV
jgi:hypothetical protein